MSNNRNDSSSRSSSSSDGRRRDGIGQAEQQGGTLNQEGGQAEGERFRSDQLGGMDDRRESGEFFDGQANQDSSGSGSRRQAEQSDRSGSGSRQPGESSNSRGGGQHEQSSSDQSRQAGGEIHSRGGGSDTGH